MRKGFHPADVALRIVAAIVGGYGLTLLSARWVASVLPLNGSEASIAASLGAWVVFIAVAMWSFAAKSTLGAAVPLVLAAALAAFLL